MLKVTDQLSCGFVFTELVHRARQDKVSAAERLFDWLQPCCR